MLSQKDKTRLHEVGHFLGIAHVLSMEGVTLYGHHPECRVTFRTGGTHIVW